MSSDNNSDFVFPGAYDSMEGSNASSGSELEYLAAFAAAKHAPTSKKHCRKNDAKVSNAPKKKAKKKEKEGCCIISNSTCICSHSFHCLLS
jgi:hypothetical protein